jgi:hypothetical protein
VLITVGGAKIRTTALPTKYFLFYSSFKCISKRLQYV